MEVSFNVNTDKGSYRKSLGMAFIPSKGDQVFIANQMLIVDNVVFVPDKSKVIIYLWREGRARSKIFIADGWKPKRN